MRNLTENRWYMCLELFYLDLFKTNIFLQRPPSTNGTRVRHQILVHVAERNYTHLWSSENLMTPLYTWSNAWERYRCIRTNNQSISGVCFNDSNGRNSFELWTPICKKGNLKLTPFTMEHHKFDTVYSLYHCRTFYTHICLCVYVCKHRVHSVINRS